MEKTVENFGVIEGVGSRLKKWRQSTKLKGYELAGIIHISQGSLSEIENNKSLPSAETLSKLYKYTKVNIFWLLVNKGPMEFSFKMKKDLLELNAELSDMIHKLVKIYKGNNQDKKSQIESLLNNSETKTKNLKVKGF